MVGAGVAAGGAAGAFDPERFHGAAEVSSCLAEAFADLFGAFLGGDADVFAFGAVAAFLDEAGNVVVVVGVAGAGNDADFVRHARPLSSV